MKKVLVALLCICMVVTLTGCSKKNTGTIQEKKTVAATLASEFEKEIIDSKPLDVLKKLSENEKIEIAVEAAELTKEDVIMGFTKEIKDYKKAYTLRPMIGSIPFIAYIFETDKPSELETELKDSADLRWNVCTEADDIETAVFGNYVFVVMAPSSFED